MIQGLLEIVETTTGQEHKNHLSELTELEISFRVSSATACISDNFLQAPS